MTFKLFNQLQQTDQQEALLKHGVYLAEREDGPFRTMLYQLNEFYVEVFFFSQCVKATFFSAFQSTDILKPYLAAIDINDVLQEAFS